jgi:hypothetical protein
MFLAVATRSLSRNASLNGPFRGPFAKASIKWIAHIDRGRQAALSRRPPSDPWSLFPGQGTSRTSDLLGGTTALFHRSIADKDAPPRSEYFLKAVSQKILFMKSNLCAQSSPVKS